MTSQANSSLVFEGGRGRNQVGQLAREFLNPTGDGVIASQLTGAINSGALIGERRERGGGGSPEMRQFPLSSTAVDSQPARMGGTTKSFGGRNPVETKEQNVSPTRTRQERGRSRTRGDERSGREYDSRSASRASKESSERSQSGTSVYRRGEYQGRVSTEGSGREQSVQSRGSQNETKQRN